MTACLRRLHIVTSRSKTVSSNNVQSAANTKRNRNSLISDSNRESGGFAAPAKVEFGHVAILLYVIFRSLSLRVNLLFCVRFVILEWFFATGNTASFTAAQDFHLVEAQENTYDGAPFARLPSDRITCPYLTALKSLMGFR